MPQTEQWKLKALIVLLIFSSSLLGYAFRNIYIPVYASDYCTSSLPISFFILIINTPLFFCYLYLEIAHDEADCDTDDPI